jgi:hypothetical protein
MVVARFKLLIMVIFLGVHIFNLCTAFHGRPTTEIDISSTLQTVTGQLRPENPVIRGPLRKLVAEYHQNNDSQPLIVELAAPIVYEAKR